MVSYLGLYNVRIAFSREKKIEERFSTVISKIVQFQGLLIATKGDDQKEVLAKIGQLKNEIKHDFKDSWDEKISELF